MTNQLEVTLGKIGRKVTLADLRKLINEAHKLGFEGKKIQSVTFPDGEMLVVMIHFTTEDSVPVAEESVSSSPPSAPNL